MPPVLNYDYYYVLAIDQDGERYFFAVESDSDGLELFERFMYRGWDAQWGRQFSSGYNAMFNDTGLFDVRWVE